MALSVIGTGFGRTGTMSLKFALEQLGFGPCYHMVAVREHQTHVDMWSRAGDGEAIDWDVLYDGYRATVGWPSTRFWRELIAAYPEAKVVHTVRDPLKWYDSVRNTIFMSLNEQREEDPGFENFQEMPRKLVLDQTFGGRFEDQDFAISVFEQHTKNVIEAVPADRLLVYEVAEGWEPLCRLLGVPLPDAPFPRTNDRAEFTARFRAK